MVLVLLGSLRGEPENSSADSDAGDLIVHEWGTFTNFSGSDGIKLEFRAIVEEDLPPFVLDRAWQSGISNPLGKTLIRGRQRMETPVTYFYTDKEREVDVRVEFPQGMLTEFFPPVQSMLPEFTAQNYFSKPEFKDSELNWGRITLIPESHLRTSCETAAVAKEVDPEVLRRLLPDVGDQPHYQYARETDSAFVYVNAAADKQHPAKPSGKFFEKFLFYRGVGNFTLPLQLTAFGEDRFQLVNQGDDPVRSLILVTVHNDELRFRSFEGIDADQELELVQATQSSTVEELGEAVVKALVAEGLYKKEAVAMVKTWSDSWFGEQGTRLFYIVPSRVTDQLLPLHVSPQPNELVRVLVGRMEIMAPEDEAAIEELVKQSQQLRQQHYKLQAEARNAGKLVPEFEIPEPIVSMGRLAEPALVRVIAVSDDVEVKREGRMLMKQLKAKLDAAAKGQQLAATAAP
jgi:hypothetical protein